MSSVRRPGRCISDVHSPGAVAERIDLDARLVKEAQMQVRKRNFLSRADVTPTLETPRAAAREQDWKRVVVVNVAVAHTAAPHQHRVIEQRALAVRRLLHLF